MTKFINENIEINELPDFEELQLNRLHPNYLKVMLFNFSLLFLLFLVGCFILLFLNPFHWTNKFNYFITLIVIIFSVLSVFFIRLRFKKIGYIFRTHDAIYKSGLISETTTIIPFNRVQHVALHQGFISRKLGLASIELFTAGESSSDIEIPGLLLEQAQKIKNLVSQKINPNASDELQNVHNILE
jgi:membrane protein YdbS with pleckstrin-like domain